MLSLSSPAVSSGALALPEGIAFKVARPALLAKNLAEADVDAASIQESRCQQGTLHVGPYYRICSGASSGQYGTEWWFRTGRTILCRSERRVTLRPDRFVVHHASPRRLLLSVSQGAARLYFLAVHAPHRGLEAHVIEEWWCETLQLCCDIIGDGDCVIAGDCNASLGAITSHFVSDHHAEQEDHAGAFLHRLLQERDAWVPATHEHCHRGQGWTYVQKRNGKHIRPDFVAIPCGWKHGSVASEVNTS